MASIPESPFLIGPTMLVRLDDDDTRLQGYLLPYHPASSLRSVFNSRYQETLTLSTSESSPCIPRSTENPHHPISWALKLIWAIDIAAALTFLHRRKIYWGDLKIDNTILCKDGHCRFIDYYPNGHSLEWSLPEVEKAIYPDLVPEDWDQLIQQALTPERDVFSLGLVLWAITEEVGDFDRVPEYTIRQKFPGRIMQPLRGGIGKSHPRVC